MSELKADNTFVFGEECLAYKKYEADKVISKLKESVKKLILDNYLKDMELRHNKYKRCLAMWMYLRECYWRCKNHNEQTRADWYNKWMNVFQKLAEKFKEAK